MGYGLYIARGEDNPIRYEEIMKLVESEPGLIIEDKVEVMSPQGEVVSILGPFLHWERDGEEIYLAFRKGKLVTSYTNDEDMVRLKYLAGKLNAKVIGEEGEEY